ncbi:DUF523 domain-containing protein [Kaistia dalseonensis]|uniref:Uncharacterized protein YbbK (DUF523 family) n=1 Tax=Kaistia dalseonensis TaxID=410840 RepID=A0ABU0HB83_9HYPH|nr:DUF523 domain-containing protein [Kaistia dalseonensis]MCX5496940.1 DUF523 domain-containing protein [Kaistia dalseonensis]MDQ0439566.1 uncharacterized protein YbbK (DUF523 family) [Kaistia dalseonensis]
MTARILVSACLLGRPVRYNGSAKTLAHSTLARWQAEGRVVSICPELMAGFSVPRAPAEIGAGLSGDAVLAGEGRVVDIDGRDVTAQFVAGAEAALAVARAHDCAFALLIDGSPSCGSGFVYGGRFDGTKHAGAGVTAALLRENGIEVFSDSEVDALDARLAPVG